MLYFDRGLFVTNPRIGIDVRHPVATGFVSHAHFDHMASHQLAYCTPATSRFYQHRLGRRRVHEMMYRQPLELGPIRFTAYPAGHMLGSAMLLMESCDTTVLYTGDFCLSKLATAEPAEVPQADVLIMECTFGHPKYSLPNRTETLQNLLDVTSDLLSNGKSPVVHAYALGKAQELTKIFSENGIRVFQHSTIFRMSKLYEELGTNLGSYREYSGRPIPGAVIVVPPRHHKASSIGLIPRAKTISVTGWAIDPKYGKKYGADFAFPISDHADYEQLLKFVTKVQPRLIYCTHGNKRFVEDLLQRGYAARYLDRKQPYCLPLE